MTQSSLDTWLNELKRLKEQAGSSSGNGERLDEWIKSQQMKVAPGFADGVMQPHKREVNSDEGVNELDKVFGETRI